MPRVYSQSVFVGDVFETKHAGKVEVVGYLDSRNVTIMFNDKRTKVVTARNLVKGEVGNEYSNRICNVGFIGIGEYSPYDKNHIATKEYTIWKGMIRRCYMEDSWDRHPTYKNCTVCDEWHNFQNFAKWYTSQDGYDKGFQLDKDLKFIGNKVYSPLTCSLLPAEINNIFVNSKANRGKWPVGVYWDKRYKKFIARLGNKGKYKVLGKFDCHEKAFEVYKSAKEIHIKTLADKYKDVIPDAIYENIMNHKVQITD